MDAINAQPVQAWNPDKDTFDQYTITDVIPEKGYVLIQAQSNLPLEFSMPLLNLGANYAPIVLMVRIPGMHNKGEYISQYILHQHAPYLDMQGILDEISEYEEGWRLVENTLISPLVTEANPDIIWAICESHRIAAELPSSLSPPAAHDDVPAPPPNVPSMPPFPWQYVIAGVMLAIAGLIVGAIAGLMVGAIAF